MKKPAAILREHLVDILDDIERGRVKVAYRSEVARIVEAWAAQRDDALARLDAIRKARSDRIRAAVRAAAERTMLERQGLSLREATGIVRRRAWAALKETNPQARKPCPKIVKTELRPYFPKTVTCGPTNSRLLSYASASYSTSPLST